MTLPPHSPLRVSRASCPPAPVGGLFPLWCRIVALVLALVVVYQPTWDAQFIWDDDAHLTAHPGIVGPLGLKEVWTTAAGHYFPLVLTTFWLVNQAFGLDPFAFHLVGVTLHIACTLMLWAVLRRLRIPGAGLGAALWGLHPVQVESVAWVSEIINTQSGLFFLLAIWFGCGWLAPDGDDAPRRRDYGLAFACATGAMLSKPSTVMLPVVLGLCCWWLRGRLHWRDATWLAPFFLIALATSGWAIWEQKVHQKAAGADWDFDFAERVIIAGKAVWFYLGKLLWPYPLSFNYPRWSIDRTDVIAWLPALAALGGLGSAAWLAWKRNGVWRGVFFAAAYHVVLLFPVLGFFDVYYFRYSFVADHFQFLSGMGFLALLGGWAGTALNAWRGDRTVFVLSRAAVAGCLLVLGALAWRHAWNFQNDETLWRATLRTNPGSVLAQNNLGLLLVESGNPSDAVRHYQRALEENPELLDARFNLAKALAMMPERLEESVAHFRAVLNARPDFPSARFNLANALAALPGRQADAIAEYEVLLRRDPNNAKAHANLGLLLGAMPDRLADAIRHGERAVTLQPNVAEAHFNLANNLARVPGREAEAIRHYEAAVRAKPGYVKAHINLGLAYARHPERLPDAVRQYEAALAIDPQSAIAHNNLAIALARSGRRDEARIHFERALAIDPGYVDARNNLAVLLGTP